MKNVLSLLIILLAIAACSSQEKEPVEPYTPKQYKNPVVAGSLPDPTVIKAPDGYFYIYATEDYRNMPIMKSKNLVQWTYCGTAFTDETRPTFEPDGGIWAPDINYINGQYVLYYAMSKWGGLETCGIGVATADKPDGPFTDHGKLFRSNEIGVSNSIDPSFLQYEGKNYLVWGSFRGIYVIEMSEDGLTVAAGAEKKQLAGTAFEAAYIHQHGDFYYLFASVGTCCNGAQSTYKVVVGRSSSVWGPYLSKEGNSMMNNRYSDVIGVNSHFVGNGHNSQIIEDNAGQDWMLYHGIDMSDPDGGRFLMLDQIKWDDTGWPYVEGGSPSFDLQDLPVLK